jgi:hypothetical protein
VTCVMFTDGRWETGMRPISAQVHRFHEVASIHKWLMFLWYTSRGKTAVNIRCSFPQILRINSRRFPHIHSTKSPAMESRCGSLIGNPASRGLDIDPMTSYPERLFPGFPQILLK